jgi:hypothetical protein
MSKSKKNLRKTIWKQKISKQVARALFLTRLVLKDTATQTLSKENLTKEEPIQEKSNNS